METLQILKLVSFGLVAILSTALVAILMYGFATIARVIYYEFKNIIKWKIRIKIRIRNMYRNRNCW